MSQTELFAGDLPEGFAYQPEFVSPAEELALICAVEQLPFTEIRMHGVIAKRRAAHFGYNYEYQRGKVIPGTPIPDFLFPLRERVGQFANLSATEFAEVLVTDYPVGAAIGWHRDAPAFDIIVGVSLLTESALQFRPWPVQTALPQRRRSPVQILERRSAYMLRGPSRTRWQHHIAPARTRRISITFRTLRHLPEAANR